MILLLATIYLAMALCLRRFVSFSCFFLLSFVISFFRLTSQNFQFQMDDDNGMYNICVYASRQSSSILFLTFILSIEMCIRAIDCAFLISLCMCVAVHKTCKFFSTDVFFFIPRWVPLYIGKMRFVHEMTIQKLFSVNI